MKVPRSSIPANQATLNLGFLDRGTDDRKRTAAVSTFPNTYNGIPHDETFDELRDVHGCALVSTMGLADGEARVVEFEALDDSD